MADAASYEKAEVTYCDYILRHLLFSLFIVCILQSRIFFWEQVHEGGNKDTYDSTQWILTALVLVLLLLVALCSAILLYNLFSLTAAQKLRSRARLVSLGADRPQLIFMALAEALILFGLAAPSGWFFAVCVCRGIGIQTGLPLWIRLAIVAWLWMLCCICSLKTVPSARLQFNGLLVTSIQTETFAGLTGKYRRSCQKRAARQDTSRKRSFAAFMGKRYFKAGQGRYVRIILTITAAILLYVPVSYVINTNLQVHRSELEQKYGIQYSCAVSDVQELTASLEECRSLAAVNTGGNSVICVQISGYASVSTELLSQKLLAVLKKAGWQETAVWGCDSDIYFLDDTQYEQYLRTCMVSESADTSGFVLVNRCINRSVYDENADDLFPETPLLDADAWARQDADDIASNIRIGYDFDYETGETRGWLTPGALADAMPEGLTFSGNITLILPLREIESVCAAMSNWWGVGVYTYFEDQDEMLFETLTATLGGDGLGRLWDSRRAIQEWYRSMHEIHLAMTAICAILFLIALLNVFGTILFQYMERRRGLAILWSLGQTEHGLLRILILENIRCFAISVLIGLPVSCVLCYYIYGIFRYVWQIGFALPLGQIALITAASVTVSAAAMTVDWFLMRRQDFLQDIRDTG